MKYVLIAVAVLVLLIGVVFLVGLLLPKAHSATVHANYKAPPEAIYQAITDVASGPRWRTGLKKIEVVSRPGEPVRWVETADWGTITFVREVDDAPRRVVARIADESQGFGGTWTYAIEAVGTGSRLTITEDGVIHNPLFRFMARFFMGYHKTLETYAQDLGRRLGESVRVER